MITKVFEKVLMLVETCVQPGELGWLELSVGCWISGFSHSSRASGACHRIHIVGTHEPARIIFSARGEQIAPTTGDSQAVTAPCLATVRAFRVGSCGQDGCFK